MGNAGYRMIARLLGVSHVAVYGWIRTEAAKLPELEITGETVILTLDEMGIVLKKDWETLDLASVWRCASAHRRLGAWWPWWCHPDLRRGRLCQKLLDKVGVQGKTFLTDDWEGFHRLIPEDQVFTGKDLTVSIEQDNGDIRHFVARFRRRTKVVSKITLMVDLSLRLYHYLHDNPQNLAAMLASFLSIFH
jgi:insertion element IS1 protein InsB